MLNFEFNNKTEIYFGKEQEKKVGDLSRQLGDKILLHYGGGSVKKFGLYDLVLKQLEAAGVTVFDLGGVKPNPRLSLIHQGVDLCKKEGIDGILALGGGSVIDSAKAIAAGVYYEGDVWDLYTGKGSIDDSLPLGVVLTLPAAGSETSAGTVVTKDKGNLKRAFGHISLRPRFAILNPDWTMTLPAYQTACGMTDMMAHVMERYFTKVRHVALTDQLCEGIMRTVVQVGPKLLADPDNYDLRAEIMWAGTLAHNDLVGTGRQDDWGTHDIEHEISGIYDIAHGAGLAIVFPAWLKYNYKEDVNRVARFAHEIFDVPYNLYNIEETALEGIRRLEAFYKSIGMPTRLSQVDIDDQHLEEMARKATDNDSKTLGSFKKMTSADILAILKLAL